jgi:hypothetical protein
VRWSLVEVSADVPESGFPPWMASMASMASPAPTGVAVRAVRAVRHAIILRAVRSCGPAVRQLLSATGAGTAG